MASQTWEHLQHCAEFIAQHRRDAMEPFCEATSLFVKFDVGDCGFRVADAGSHCPSIFTSYVRAIGLVIQNSHIRSGEGKQKGNQRRTLKRRTKRQRASHEGAGGTDQDDVED